MKSSYQHRKEQFKRGVFVLPSLITTASLFCGFLAILQSMKGNFVQASWMIVVCGLFDSLDGRVARWTKTQSDFGVQYDSLVDCSSFGLAPAFLMYNWGFHHFGRLGLAISFFFACCVALRLARFNTQVSVVEKKYFKGLASPAAAGLVISFILFNSVVEIPFYIASKILLFLSVCSSLLMVSNIYYRSFKGLDFTTPQSFIYLVFFAILLVVVASAPQETLFLIGMVYGASGPIEYLWYLKNKKNYSHKHQNSGPINSEKLKLLKLSETDKKVASP